MEVGGLGDCFLFIYLFFCNTSLPFCRDRAATWERRETKVDYISPDWSYRPAGEAAFNEYYPSDIWKMSQRARRPHRFQLRRDVRPDAGTRHRKAIL